MRVFRRLSVTALLSVLLLWASPSRADDLQWAPGWTRVGPGHLVGVGLTLGMTAGAMQLPQAEAGFDDGVLFDNFLREHLVLGSRRARGTAEAVGDVLYWGLFLYPPVIDIGVVTLAVHQSPDVAWQLLWMDAQAYGLAGLVSRVTQKLVGRQRSYNGECEHDPTYDDGCDDPGDRNQSFVSGHTAIAFTGATLMCAQHLRLDLYRNEAADALACSLGLAAASYVGYSRILADRHYATDVLAGVALGVASGWLVPELLYYHFGDGWSAEHRIAIAPAANASMIGVVAFGEL